MFVFNVKLSGLIPCEGFTRTLFRDDGDVVVKSVECESRGSGSQVPIPPQSRTETEVKASLSNEA